MEFRCFNGMHNCDYCGSCHSEFKARTSDEKRRIYNQALEDVMKIYNEMQPRLATNVYEFGKMIKALKK